uniref:Uncharacterized protein n=1 Tax=Solanum tuberosum TaxID=4113 RepID=M1DFI6_SOLTU
MEGESSNTYEDFEQVPLPTDPNWLVIPQLRGNIGRIFGSEQSAFDMNSDELDALSMTVQGISISLQQVIGPLMKPKPKQLAYQNVVPDPMFMPKRGNRSFYAGTWQPIQVSVLERNT